MGGRFQQQPEEWVDAFNASIDFDQTLLDEDIQGSIAHTTMLAHKTLFLKKKKCHRKRFERYTDRFS